MQKDSHKYDFLYVLETNTWRESWWVAYFSAIIYKQLNFHEGPHLFPILKTEYNLNDDSSWSGMPVLSQVAFRSILHFPPLLNAIGYESTFLQVP